MSTSIKFSLLFLIVAAVLLALGTITSAGRTLDKHFAALTERIEAYVSDSTDLPLAVYGRNTAELRRVQRNVLAMPGVTSVTILDYSGKQMVTQSDSSLTERAVPSLSQLRQDASESDTVIATYLSATERVENASLFDYLRSDRRTYISVPILTAVNPAQPNMTASDFLTARLEKNPKTRVIGYLQAGTQMQRSLYAALSGFIPLVISGLLLTLAGVFFLLRSNRPVAQLRNIAGATAEGILIDNIEISGGEDFQEIARALNKVVERDREYRIATEAGRKALEKRAGETAMQLSERESKLDQASKEIERNKTQLHELAYYDTLTKLPNRNLFNEQLNLLLSMNQKERKSLALIFLNLKKFGRINDSVGQAIGDLVLSEVGKRLSDCVRNGDLLSHYVDAGHKIHVSRLGGDEFAVVLNQIDRPDSAGLVAEHILRTLAEPISVDSHDIVVTPSMGIALAPTNAVTVEELLRCASLAMHEAKSLSKGGHVFFDSEMTKGALEQLKLEEELRKALENDQFSLNYQPQVDTTDGSVVCAEALLRWEHPEYGQVPPNQFIPLAEDIGMMEKLGAWVLREACRELKAIREEGLELPRVSVNISAMQFNDDFGGQVKSMLNQIGLSADSLELGLSGGILIDQTSGTIDSLRNLGRLGVHLSLDNFGISSTPLSYLSKYPLDELKIDRSVVSGCHVSEHSASVVRAIIAVADSLGLRTVAQGVESEKEFNFLLNNGARAMQGYLFSKPISAQDLREILRIPWHYMSEIQRMQYKSS